MVSENRMVRVQADFTASRSMMRSNIAIEAANTMSDSG
jgi:hypothetical protein